MGSCIICGNSVDGRICNLHEEDVLFEFRGTSADELSVGRYYRGSVDGFAEFGVFVDIGDRVTGLLHRSELDQRLDSLDWEPGEQVCVQVKNVRDNGNVDLGWSIRQSEREFRGLLIDDPDEEGAFLPEDFEDGDETPTAAAAGTDSSSDQSDSDDSAGAADTAPPESQIDADSGTVSQADTAERTAGAVGTSDDGGTTAATSEDGTTATAGGNAAVVEETPEPTDASVAEIEDLVGDHVRLEGEIVTARQTSGPTVFELRDETGTVDCAAFVEAGVRAYPGVEEGDIVRLDGEVRKRRDELQVETEELTVLEGEERETVQQRLASALEERARPDAVEPLASDPAVEALADDLIDAATAIRRAVLTERPVIVRHSATADGYVAGVALERATLPLVREEHSQSDAEYHYFDRRPLEGGVYDMDDATRDTTTMLDNRERHDEKLPLFVFVAAGGTRESLDGFELLDVYGAPRVVVDDADADPDVAEAVDTIVTPSLADAPDTTAAALAANVAAHVNDDVREDLLHLPAVSFWDDTPAAYLDAAETAGYDADTVRKLREAVALEAHYQSYEDKRELVTDLLFGESGDAGGLAGHIAEQFETKLDTAVETAEANLDSQTVGGEEIAVLDTDAYTHRYDFPPTTLLLDELYRREGGPALVGAAEDELYIRTDAEIDVHEIADDVSDRVPEGSVSVTSARDRSLGFLAGERSAVLDATLDVLAGHLEA